MREVRESRNSDSSPAVYIGFLEQAVGLLPSLGRRESPFTLMEKRRDMVNLIACMPSSIDFNGGYSSNMKDR